MFIASILCFRLVSSLSSNPSQISVVFKSVVFSDWTRVVIFLF